MYIPINGRIAIVDDNFSQAFPIMEFFGKRRMPYVYYNGDPQGLPEEGSELNDIRLLFLDIYLTGDSIKSPKDLKSTMYSVLNRLISERNYPYILIYWSRHENEHNNIIESLFKNELKSKAPISILSIQKADYFSLTDDKTEDFDDKIAGLLDRIRGTISPNPIFQYLLSWENLIHKSADKTLEDIFKMNEGLNNWESYSKFLFYKLALGYAGRTIKEIAPNEQIKNAFYSLNNIFNDSLELSITNVFTAEYPKLEEVHNENTEILSELNKRLLTSGDVPDKYMTGVIFKTINKKHEFNEILNFCINRDYVFDKNKDEFTAATKDITEFDKIKKIKEKFISKKLTQLKRNLEKDIIFIEVNVSPVCDYVQNKCKYYRILPGLLLNSNYLEYVIKGTEAIYISPKISLPEFSGQSHIMLLDFRYFTSITKEEFENDMDPYMRIRQTVLSEVQSKLSRHINRQGIIFLE